MSFQFQCPQGHLLEGDPSHAGQTCHCPTCGMLFIIPAPLVAPVAPPAPMVPSFGYPGEQPQGRFAHLEAGPAVTAPPADPASMLPPGAEQAAAPAETAVAEETPPPEEPEILHIPCPNGHELETPVDMLEQDVLCPHCKAQFRLRKTDSVEYKRKHAEQERLKEIKAGNFWLNAAIVAAVLVGLLIVGLVILSTLGSTPSPTPSSKKQKTAGIITNRSLVCLVHARM